MMKTCPSFRYITLSIACVFNVIVERQESNQFVRWPGADSLRMEGHLYVSHDKDDTADFKMANWKLYTASDMVKWTDQETNKSLATTQ